MTSLTSKTRGAGGVATRRRQTKGIAARRDERRFAAVRAVQAGKAYFVTACPLRLVPKILSFDSPDLPPQLRAQRVLNKARVPQIARYLSANPTSYVLSAITASIDADARFEPHHASSGNGMRIGDLVVPSEARILVNDGQHRRAAIAEALESRPELANESIPLVLFLDAGLTRSQQIFADLNRHAIRPPTSLNVLYDHRDRVAQLVRKVAAEVCPFSGLTELEKSSLSNRSSKMFTLSAIHQATRGFLGQRANTGLKGEDEQIIVEFWRVVGMLIQKWGFPTDVVTAADLRKRYIHAHAVALHALGVVGGELVAADPDGWQDRLILLETIDWARSNPLWEGRAVLHNGRISKSSPSLILTANVLRQRLGLRISDTNLAFEDCLPEERRVGA